MPVNLDDLTISSASRAVTEGEITATALVEASLDAIDERDREIGAFLRVDAEPARRRAAEIDGDPDARRLPLAGIPIAVKDNICVQGRRTTAGSRALEPFTVPYSATVIDRLRAAGAVCVGAANLDEFGMGSSTENSAFRTTVNPWDRSRVPGGSSGGSAAAVASGQVLGALGSDTGGSIRQPAAFCGLVGLKPTYGRVSRYGLIAFASSLDQIGPLAATVEDTALLLEVIAGDDPRDATVSDRPVPAYPDGLTIDPGELTLGVPEPWFGEGLSDPVRRSVESTLRQVESEGVELRPIQLPHQEYAVATYYVIATAEASSNLARYDGVRYGLRAEAPGDVDDLYRTTRSRGFGDEVKRRVLLGTFVLSAGYYEAYFDRAQRARTLIRRDFERAFTEVDAIVGPTTPTTAFELGDKIDDPLSMYLNDVYTVTASLAGLPGASVPCGLDDSGLPVGLQVIGPAFDEEIVLQVARTVESIRGRSPLPYTDPPETNPAR